MSGEVDFEFLVKLAEMKINEPKKYAAIMGALNDVYSDLMGCLTHAMAKSAAKMQREF